MVLGGAYGIATNIYASDKVTVLENQVEIARTEATAEVTRAAEIEAKALELQEEARRQIASAGSLTLTQPAPAASSGYGLGRTALAEEIAAWDVDVLPDGRGLPQGSGNAANGEEVFVEKCGSCHGDFAEGVDNWPVLAGGFDTLGDKDPVKTVGSYWPYLSTVWDYVHRSMPFGEAGTLSADETYAIVAYILYSNDVIDEDFELSHQTFTDVEMHNAEGFIVDDRADLEYNQWRAEPCMENCKDEVQITMRTVFLVEEPPEGGSNSVVNPAREVALPSFTIDGPSFIPEATAQPVETASVATQDSQPADDNSALIAAGEKAFKKCKACHQIGDGAKNKTGPHLNGIMGRTMGTTEGFSYSNAFKTAADEGRIWDDDSMSAFLIKPKQFMKGTKMSFAGFKKDDEIAAVIAYLREVGQ